VLVSNLPPSRISSSLFRSIRTFHKSNVSLPYINWIWRNNYPFYYRRSFRITWSKKTEWSDVCNGTFNSYLKNYRRNFNLAYIVQWNTFHAYDLVLRTAFLEYIFSPCSQVRDTPEERDLSRIVREYYLCQFWLYCSVLILTFSFSLVMVFDTLITSRVV
jgi:hypothetical protein